MLDRLLYFFSVLSAEIKPGSKILVACSGGPDSVALARALRTIQSQVGVQFLLGHVNHQLRGKASDQDEAFVKNLAKEMGWEFHRRKGPLSLKSGNLEAQARVRRYAALNEMALKAGCVAIVTAHNLDDQVETVLMNLIRGSGVDGLAGMPHVRRHQDLQIPVYRPFFYINKDEILQFLKKGRYTFRVDRSNKDQSFLRNWLRKSIVPLIEKRAKGFKNRVANLAAIVRDEQSYWEEVLNEVQKKVGNKGPKTQVDFGGLLRYPDAVQKRFLRRVAGQDLLTYEGVEGLRRWMKSPPTSGRFWMLRKGWIVERLSKSKGSPSTQLFMFKENKKA